MLFSTPISKLVCTAFLGLAGAAVMGQTAIAADTNAIRQLLQTNRCEGCDLSGANLRGLNLSEANLRGANLQQAQISFADFSRADLRQADLQGAEITGTIFQGASLQEANLTNAQVVGICPIEEFGLDLTDCITVALIGNLGPEFCAPDYGIAATLSNSVSWIADICTAGWESSDFFYFVSTTNFAFLGAGVNFMGADLWGANLTGVDLTIADLRYAQLTQANLQDANLTYALLFDAELDGVRNAELDPAILTKAEVGQALGGLFEQQAFESRQSAALSSVGAMNRAQQAYYVEFSKFTNQYEVLGTPESEYGYQFVISQVTEAYVINRAIAPSGEGLKHYLGVVYTAIPDGSESALPHAILCESSAVNVDSAAINFDLPIMAEAEANCPAGWSRVNSW